MSAEKVIHALLAGAAPVTALVGANIWPGEMPQGTLPPALGISHISTTELSTMDAMSPYSLLQSRIEVTILAKDYPTQKDLLKKVRQACNFQRGILSGVSVTSVVRDLVGADLHDSDLQIFSQTIDFLVTWQDPNP